MNKWSMGLLATALIGLSACGSTKISCDQNRDYFKAVEYPALEGDIAREDAYSIPRNVGRASLEDSSCLHVPPVNQGLMDSSAAPAPGDEPKPRTIEEAVAQ